MLEDGIRKLDVCDMNVECGRLHGSVKTIAIVKDRLSPQTTKQDRDRTRKQFPFNIWTTQIERRNVGGVSIKSRSGVLRLQKDA